MIDGAADVGIWVAAVVAVLSILNKLTVHYSLGGPTWRRLLLVLLELGSVLTSSGARNVAGHVKLPMTSVPPDIFHGKGGDGGDMDVMLIALTLLGLFAALLLAGCNASWYAASRSSIDTANDATRLIWQTTLPVLEKRCERSSAPCTKKGLPMDQCTQHLECVGNIRNIGSYVVTLHAMVAAARDALDEAYAESRVWDGRTSQQKAMRALALVLSNAQRVASALGQAQLVAP